MVCSPQLIVPSQDLKLCDHVILPPPSLSSALGLLWLDKGLCVCLTEGGAVLQTHLTQDDACTSTVFTQNLECCEELWACLFVL